MSRKPPSDICPHIAVDVVVFGVDVWKDEAALADKDGDREIPGASALGVLLMERNEAPYRGRLALPGGFVKKTESLEDAAFRILRDKTGTRPAYIEQLYTMGEPRRDPRQRVVSVTYMALVRQSDQALVPGANAVAVHWLPVTEVENTAFDHDEIIERALERLVAKVRYAPIGFDLLPETFSVSQLHRLYEAILGRSIDKRNFYKKISSLRVLEDAGTSVAGNGKGRPARLYRFDKSAYEALTEKGINFEI